MDHCQKLQRFVDSVHRKNKSILMSVKGIRQRERRLREGEAWWLATWRPWKHKNQVSMKVLQIGECFGGVTEASGNPCEKGARGVTGYNKPCRVILPGALGSLHR